METLGNVVLRWKDNEYTVTPDSGMMRMLSSMQDYVSLRMALDDANDISKANLARYASAYAAALNIAGCKVTDMEVYKEIVSGRAAALVVYGVIQIYLSLHPVDPTKKKSPVKKKQQS